MTQAPSLVQLFIVPLNAARMEYMVTGGLAAVVYGHPRLTLDVDLVIRLEKRETVAFAARWDPSAFCFPAPETIAVEAARGEHGHFKVIHLDSAMRADVYVAGSDALTKWAMQHKVERTVEGQLVKFAPIEYVIAYKLRYFQLGGSDRHLRDVARMLEISGSDIDGPTLESWIEQLKLGDAWSKARSF